MAQVQIGRGGIDAEFDAQRPALRQLGLQFLFRNDFGAAARDARPFFA